MFLPQWTISASDFLVRRKTLHDSSHKKVYLFQNLIFEGTHGFLFVCAYSKPAPGCLAWEVPLNKHLKENISQALLMRNIRKLLHWNCYWKRIVIHCGQDSGGWEALSLRMRQTLRHETESHRPGGSSVCRGSRDFQGHDGPGGGVVGPEQSLHWVSALLSFLPALGAGLAFYKGLCPQHTHVSRPLSVLVSNWFCRVFLGLLQLSLPVLYFLHPFLLTFILY